MFTALRPASYNWETCSVFGMIRIGIQTKIGYDTDYIVVEMEWKDIIRR
jgi:hypothetical protein